MVTNPEGENAEKRDARSALEAAARTGIAGHPSGAVRRIVLYAVTLVGLLVGGTAGVAVGAVALLLLLATDSLA